MFGRQKYAIVLCILFLICSTLCFSPISLAQDETNDAKIIERYKLMLSRKPKEGSTFDRLYQFYLEGDGLEKMVTDYQAEVQAKPNDPNVQLILGHIYKRLGKDKEALTAYQRGVELAPNNYYAYFALGQLYVTLRQHEDAIRELAKAVTFSEQSQSVSPEELTEIYKTLGHAYFSRDKLDDAIKAWKKISELDPQNVFARIELADLFREKELYPQAIAQHQAIIDTKKDDPYRRCLSLREIGKIHEDTGEYEKAREHYDKALSLTATGNWLRKDLQHRIIAIYAADANWKDLITYYQDKLKANPNDPELLGLLAAAYIENQQLEEGTDTYKKGLELAPTDTGLRLSLITALRNAEKFEDAAAEYESLSEQQPDNFGIYRELGKLYLQLENEDKAKAVYQRMIDQDPQNASTHLTLAEIYTGHEWMEDAAAAYQQAISLAPQNLDYIEYFGEFYFRQGNREKAVETWDQMVADDKRTAENYDRLARLLEAKKFSTEAIDASKKAVELMPDAYRFREALAKRLMSNKQYDEALLEYNEAIKLAPNDFFAEQMDDQRIELYRQQGTLVEKIEAAEEQLNNPELADADKFAQLKRLAKMYLKSNNTTYALEILLKAKALHPNDITVNRETANLYTKQGRRDEAIAIYTHLTDIDSTNAREYHANIANAYLKGMDFEAAIDAAKQVIAHSPRNPEGHQLLAEIAKQSANYEAAIDSYKQAIRLRPEAIDIRTELAALYNRSGNSRQAIAQYWRCWELSDNISDKISFIKPLTEAYYDLGRRGELEEKLKQMAKSNTSGVGPVLALAQVYRIEGDLSKAQFQLARALDRQRENSELLSQLVDISLDLGDIQEALTYQQRLVMANPDPIHQQKLGELLFDVGREQEAVQAWSKVLHAKNQTLEAEVKLARLLIRHGLLEEALFALDSAAEKISGKDAHLALYQIGATLVEINESERAIPHFQRIIAMPEPAADSTATTASNNTTTSYGPPGINTSKLALPHNILNRIQRQPYGYTSRQAWRPNSFDEAQAGALVQLKIIMEEEGKLNELVEQFEKNAEKKPKDVQTLEQLAQLYVLTGNHQESEQITERLIAASPNNPAYQGMQLNMLHTQDKLDYEALMQQLEKMSWLTPEARHWYMADFARRFNYQGQKEDAGKLLDDLEKIKVINPNILSMLAETFVQAGRVNVAEKMISQFSATTSQLSQQHVRIYQTLATTYLRDGKIDKAVALYWQYLERTKPSVTNSRRTMALSTSTSYSYGGYSQIQANFPAPTTYYTQDRLQSLQQFFNQLWINDQQQALYTVLQTQLEAAEGRDRIYPALAMCYCYWWENKRETSLEMLSGLQKEFADDLTLKLNTALVSIQAGEHKAALELLNNLADADPRNRRQYYDLTLQIAVHIGDTVTVRELITKVLNSPSSVRELYQFSQKLQRTGLTKFAIAVAKKTMTLAMRERDANFLVQLSQHLEQLGRGQDAARIAARALQFANQKDRYGQMLYSYQFQQAARLASRSMSVSGGNRAAQLIEAAEKNPNSFQAQLRLASYYEGRNQINNASKAYEAALTLRPKDYTTRMRYAQMLQRNRQSKKAVTQYSILLKDKNNINAVYSNYWEVVRTFVEAREMDKLVSLAKELIEPDAQNARGTEFARRAAEECIRNKNPKGAVQIYEKMMESGRMSVYHQLADAYSAAGQREKAIQMLRDKLQTEPEEAKVRIVLKFSKFDETQDEIKTLSTKYDEAINKEKVEPSLLYLAIISKIVANNIEATDPILNRLLEDVPSRSRLQWLNTVADTYKEKRDVDREIRTLEAAIQKVDPQSYWQLSDTYRKLGTAYSQKGEKEKAQGYVRKMGTLRLMRRGAPPFYEKENVARTYVQHEMWDDAELLLTEVINDLSADQYYKERAQQQLMTIRQKRDGVTGDEQANLTGRGNIALQRAMAQQHMRRNQIPEAIKVYEQLAKAMPEDLESRSQLANLYSRQKQHDKALETWQALLEADPENTKYQDGIIRAYQSVGKLNDAIQLALKYIQDDSENGVHYARLAQLYGSSGQVENAITNYKKAIELSPGNAQVYEQLGRLYLRNNKVDDAEKAFNEALQYAAQDGQRQNIERQLMQIYQRKGKLDEFLKEAEKRGTLTFDMQKEIARNFNNQGKLDEAGKAYEKALQMTTREWEQREVERQLLAIYRRQGKLEEKLKDAKKKGTLTFNMQVELARQYRAKGESKKAIDAYKEALDMMSASSYDMERAYRELMQEYVRRGEDNLAIELYETMNQADSSGTSTSYSQSSGFVITFGNDEARQILINAYKGQGKLDQLKTIFESKLAKNVKDPINLEIVAEIYRNSRNHEKAAETYHALSKAAPENIRAFYYAAAEFSKGGKPEQAEEMLNQGTIALSTSPRKGETSLLSSLGSICYESKMYTPAIKLFKDALAAHTSRMHGGSRWEEEGLYELIGKSALATKQYEEAVEAYQQLKKIARNNKKKENAEKAIKQAYKDGKLHQKEIPKQIKKVEDNPDDVDARLALAQSYELTDKEEEAIAQYQKISELQPDKAQWHKKIGDLYERSTQTNKQERLDKAAAAYEKAISLETDSYQLYASLAKIHTKQNDLSKAEAVYRQALQASLKPAEHDSAVKAILEIYDGKEHADKRLAILKELGTKTENSPFLQKKLGDTYIESGDMDKAAAAYKKWLEIPSDESNQGVRAQEYFQLAEELLNENVLLDVALELAKRAAEIRSESVYFSTLGHAYLANEQYDKALEQLQRSLNLMNQSGRFGAETEIKFLLTRISQIGKNVKDKARYIEMMGKLINVIPDNLGNELQANLSLAEFCRELGMTNKAKTYILKTGFFPETAWLTLGPFDNTKGVGYNTAYIPEETTQIDAKVKYDGALGQVAWKQGTDETFDGFFSFGDAEKYHAAYAWITFTSPEERKAQIRFDSDDQGKVWLNGKKVYAHRRTRGAQVDRRTIPVTLIAGQNTILVKVCNESLPWGFYLRITNTEGTPFDDLKLVTQ
ncbi:MAG: tetratricopeptide repeat protein [Candidatus Poribacteria bacterium]|nr:tetratricopeptide repeat protein [Candidatus Poribacteria bacterium]